MPSPEPRGAVADAQRGNWVDQFAPEAIKPYARLARWDRPIGFWLLFWPCGFALALAAVADPGRGFNWVALILMFIGAIAMRGAGCTLNDIVDAKIDAQVERTRSRPIPSGQVSKQQAAVFLVVQALVGLVILLQFNALTIGLGALSLVLIAIYPFMKRITWWPQLFLGLAFSWGALLGWSSQIGSLGWAPILLYAGSILWVIGYDTIYALQDVEDDALVGVRSSARALGAHVKPGVAVFYALALAFWAAAFWQLRPDPLATLTLLPVALHFAWQALTLVPADGANALTRFRANRNAGLLMFAACFVVGQTL